MNESENNRPCGSHLDAMEREQTSIVLAQGLSCRAIGRQLMRPASEQAWGQAGMASRHGVRSFNVTFSLFA